MEHEHTKFDRVVEVARKVGHILTGPHLLASHGDHLPTEPSIQPQLTGWDDMGTYYEGER